MYATIPSNTLTLMWKSACTWILRGRGSLTTTFVLTLLLYSWINKHRKEWSEQETVGSLLTQECCDSRYMPISLIAAQHLFFFFFFKLKKFFWLCQEDPLEKGMATHSTILPGEFHGQRSLASYSPWDRKESDMTDRLMLTLSMWDLCSPTRDQICNPCIGSTKS